MDKEHAVNTLVPMLQSIQDMAFCGRYLVLALDESGLCIADASSKIAAAGKNLIDSKKSFTQLPLKVLRCARSLQCQFGSAKGFYAICFDSAGAESYEWVAMELR